MSCIESETWLISAIESVERKLVKLRLNLADEDVDVVGKRDANQFVAANHPILARDQRRLSHGRSSVGEEQRRQRGNAC
jgi:hypothetical protein